MSLNRFPFIRLCSLVVRCLVFRSLLPVTPRSLGFCLSLSQLYRQILWCWAHRRPLKDQFDATKPTTHSMFEQMLIGPIILRMFNELDEQLLAFNASSSSSLCTVSDTFFSVDTHTPAHTNVFTYGISCCSTHCFDCPFIAQSAKQLKR